MWAIIVNALIAVIGGTFLTAWIFYVDVGAIVAFCLFCMSMDFWHSA